VAEELRSALNHSGLSTRELPSTVQYGLHVNGAYVPLVSLSPTSVWVQIPMRAVRALGDESFVACKQELNKIANFYRPEDVSDPTKTNALGPRYNVLDGKTEAFITAISLVANTMRDAIIQAEGG